MNRSGFTLIELAIVIGVIGLIIGGITVGSELLRQSQLQGVMQDFKKYENAIDTFQEKYNALPGDMPDAYTYWPGLKDANGNSYTNAIVCDTDGFGFNGNGDGLIQEGEWIRPGEYIRVWTHLAAAGIVPGTYYSSFGGSIIQYDLKWGLHMPEGEIPDSGISVMSSQIANASCQYQELYQNGTPVHGRKGNYLMLAKRGKTNGMTGNSGKMINGGAITTGEALSIDAKFDDGKPKTGKLYGRDPYNQTVCLNGTNDYNVANAADNQCRLVYWLQ